MKSKLAKILSLVAAIQVGVPAYAAYDQPVTWEDMSSMDLRTVFRSQYASASNLMEPSVSDSQLDLALLDADARINPEFHVPPGMRESVQFWLKVYTQLTTQHAVIFDDRHPELVYTVLDFRQLAKTARNRVVYEIVSHNRTVAALAAYRKAFRQLAKHPHPKHPTAIEQSILSTIKALKHKHSFAELSQGLRVQTGQRDNIMKGLLAADAFFPKMEILFSKMGIPPEITRLSLVESSFNLKATSRVGAAGVWQFMPKSGKEYMVVDSNRQLDERLSPLKATVAAGRLLKRNKKILSSWALALTSYNHGFSGLKEIPARQKTFSQISKIFGSCPKTTKHKTLGWAGRNYYAEFLAVLHAEAYRHLFYGTAPSAPVRPLVFYRIPKKQSAFSLALERGIPIQEFQFFNPDIRNIKRPLPSGYWVAIPGEDDNLAGLTRFLARTRLASHT